MSWRSRAGSQMLHQYMHVSLRNTGKMAVSHDPGFDVHSWGLPYVDITVLLAVTTNPIAWPL